MGATAQLDGTRRVRPLLTSRTVNLEGRAEKTSTGHAATIARFHPAPPPRRTPPQGQPVTQSAQRRCPRPAQGQNELRHPLVRALALHGVPHPPAGSHLGSPLRPGRPVLTRGVSRHWKVSGLCPHRRLTERGAAPPSAPPPHQSCQAGPPTPVCGQCTLATAIWSRIVVSADQRGESRPAPPQRPPSAGPPAPR
jgi:hypothetical protein